MLFNHSKFLGFSVAKTRQNLNLESMKYHRGKSKVNVLAVATHRSMTTTH